MVLIKNDCGSLSVAQFYEITPMYEPLACNTFHPFDRVYAHGSFLEVFRQKNVPAGFSMKSSYILFTDSKTVLG